MSFPFDPNAPRDLAERTSQVERTGHAADSGRVDALDAARWRQIAALMREIDNEKRISPRHGNASGSFQGMDDDELLDLALKALRVFPDLVKARDQHQRILNHLRLRGWEWITNPTEAIDEAARLNAQRAQLLDVFAAVNAVAGPNVWLKQMREAIEQMDHNDGDSMLDLLSRALDARGTVDDLFGVWDTTGPDEGGTTGETGDCGDVGWV